MIRIMLVGVFAAVALQSTALACPFPPNDLELLQFRTTIQQALVRIETLGSKECTGVGTGFFVNSAGLVATAEHVVPANCTGATIMLRWSKGDGSGALSDFVPAHVVEASSLDVAILQPDAAVPRNLAYLRLEGGDSPAVSYKDRCVLLASYFAGQQDPLTSFAEVSSTNLEIGDLRWALGGEGFNASRSGSPLVLADGNAVGIFIGRPSQGDDREKVIQDRAYFIPFRNIPDTEAVTKHFTSNKTWLDAFPRESSPDVAKALALRDIETAFGFSITQSGFQTDLALPTYLISDSGALSEVSSLAEGIVRSAIEGGALVRQVSVDRSFYATPGSRFLPDTVSISIASHNPPRGELPDHRCETESSRDCYQFTNDFKTLRLRFSLYPGIDGRRSWVDGEVHLRQRYD